MARILVIDDDPDLREMVGQTLEGAGYEVSLAADGKEGMVRQGTNPADLVITDLYMPIQDGVETIREFRLRFPEVAIIAMTGRPNAGTMLSIAQNLSAVGILRKPFVADELIGTVAKALGRGSTSQ